MWRPTSAVEVTTALAAGPLVETESFDAKEDLPQGGRTKDLAKDVAAMATAGGVLLYGVGEDDSGRASIPTPIPLAGAEERVRQIVRSGIAQPPEVHVRLLRLDEDPDSGFLLLEVPASPAAPHMVTLGGDYRYYRRVGTTNAALTEDEVARLYERRQRWTQDDGAVLDAALATTPLVSEAGVRGVSTFTVTPVAPPPDLLGDAPAMERGLPDLFIAAFDSEPFWQDGWDDLRDVLRRCGWDRRIDGIHLTTLDGGDDSDRHVYEWDITVSTNGSVVFHGPVVYPRALTAGSSEVYSVHEHRLVQECTRILKAAALASERSGYFGVLALGLHVGGLRGAMSQVLRDRATGGVVPARLVEGDFRNSGRWSVLSCTEAPREAVRSLTAPLLHALRSDEVESRLFDLKG